MLNEVEETFSFITWIELKEMYSNNTELTWVI